jgi:hypothetical protein
MALQAIGTVSLSDLQTEFGGVNPINISDYYRGGTYVPNNYVNLAIPTSGIIKPSRFYSGSGDALGVNWTILTTGIASNFALTQIASNGENIIVAAYQAGDIIYSNDYGVTWTNVSTPFAEDLWGCTYADGYFYIVGRYGNGVQRSINGITWTSSLSVNNRDHNNINYNDGYLIIGTGVGGGNGFIYSSTNGTSWIQSTYVGANSVFCGIYVAALNRTFASGAQNKYHAGVPNSTSSWASATGLTTMRGVAWSPTAARACAISLYGGIFQSTNLVNWSQVTSNSPTALHNIQWCNNQFIVVGDGGKLLTSTDGLTWVTQYTGTTAQLLGVAAISPSSATGAALFVTAGNNVLRS